MRTRLFVVSLFAFAALSHAADSQWLLQDSTLTYHVSHPVHQSEGVSHAARGKGVCHAEQCDFLVAVPVKSFDSGDSNRDLHMLQTTRGAEFPVVTVRFRLPGSTPTHPITGIIPSTLTEFKIAAPTFLTVPIKNEIPIRVDMSWHPS